MIINKFENWKQAMKLNVFFRYKSRINKLNRESHWSKMKKYKNGKQYTMNTLKNEVVKMHSLKRMQKEK